MRRRELCGCSTRSRRATQPAVILASHGNLIALALHAFMPNVGYDFWESIPMPAVFTLTRDRDHWTAFGEERRNKFRPT
ncbi:MAG: hypothetical protein WA217_08505 [Candidatus Binatus sp.]